MEWSCSQGKKRQNPYGQWAEGKTQVHKLKLRYKDLEQTKDGHHHCEKS